MFDGRVNVCPRSQQIAFASLGQQPHSSPTTAVSACVEGGRGVDRGEKRDLTVYCLEIPDQVTDFSFSFEDVYELQLAAPPAPST